MPHLAKLLRALADPNRLRIVNLLSHKSLCVCDLQSVLDLPQPFISRHLAYLRRGGLVRCERAGARVCYSLALGTPFGQALQSFLRETLPLSPNFQADLRKLSECGALGRLKSVAGGIDQLESKAA